MRGSKSGVILCVCVCCVVCQCLRAYRNSKMPKIAKNRLYFKDYISPFSNKIKDFIVKVFHGLISQKVLSTKVVF